ncbi:MAG: hypothetical protein WA655_10785 [Candidatus Korobacteraceae bacterium]
MNATINPAISAAAARQSGLAAAVPVLFLPVNIETRFMTSAAGAPELWVRIYPDQIAINSHEPELTAQEIADGQAYWDAVWRAGKPPASIDTIKAPWRGLAQRYGSPRAAWIALQMTPTNLPSQPAAATPDGATPNPAPVYPTPPTRTASWTKPAITEALPDAWTVVTVSGTTTQLFRSGPITPELAVSLTPPATGFPPGSPVDSGMLWLVDFDTALQAGMAVKIPLAAQQRASGFDRLFVYGLCSETQSNGNENNPPTLSGSDTFAAVLDDHHYSDGFSLLPQGAPTNNTSDASSFYSRKDPDFEISFSVERQDPLDSDPADDGNAFAAAIGIDPGHLAHVRSADGFGVRNGRDMFTALWPATLGYFLSQMMASAFTPAEIETTRQYVLANAIPRGALPAFSVGKTPYGVLPVTSLRRYPTGQIESPAGTVEPKLADFVLRLWQNWLASSTSAPHMENTGDPDAELIALLGMDASSMTFRGRKVLGDTFLWNYALFNGITPAVFNTWWATHLSAGRQLLNNFGYNALDPRVIHLGLENSSFPVPFPTVQSAPLSESEQLAADADLGGGVKGNYIQWLRQTSVADIQAENYPGPKPTSLLYKILRQSMILDYADLASTAEISAARLDISQVREQEIVAVAPAPTTAPPLTTWEILARPSIPNPDLTWADFLLSFDPPPESPFARLADLRASLDRLAGLSTAELDRLLTETLDACSHRLDVWATAIANALLQRKRSAQVAGVHLGGFGWVEEVRPSATPAPVTGTELENVRLLDQRRAQTLKLQATLPLPVQPAEDNGGYILAPSLAQASVAAVLRNGYMTHKGTTEEGLLSIDLSSERVRKALYLLEGVQQGQSLNALLGYLFEAGLHDLNLDKYAQPFRDRFPVVANKLTPSSDPSESVAASNVVDGVALRGAWDAGQLPAGGNWGTNLPPAGSSDQNQVIGLFQTLDDYADALGDLSISEAVFQIMRGNFGRTGTLLDAISKGQRPPTPDVVDTPRGGIDLTHRVALLFAGNPTVNPPWSSATMRPRAAAEPWIDAWLSQLLPDPASVTCNVKYHDAGGDQSRQVSLRDLDVRPEDVLAMADVSSTPQKGELETRILFAATLPADATNVAIDFASASPASISFPDAFFLAKSLRTVISSARALAPQDMTVPEVDAAPAGGIVDITDLRTRTAAAVASLQNDVQALISAASLLPGNPDPARAALLRCSFYGVTGSIPLSSTGQDPNLAVQAASVTARLQDRLNKASAVVIATAQAPDLSALMGTIFGADFVVLPRFTPPDFASLQSAFSQSAALIASDAQAPARWLTQLTHIRPGISRLDAAYSLAQLLGATNADPAAFLLGQIPATAGDKWLGLGIDPANPPAKGRVAFACLTGGDPLTQNSYAGLLIDEWPERIPSLQENASVAFHYEEPKARAPQALLLAVCPDNRAVWDDDLITGILQETLELTKIRSVDLDSVAQVGQILPALYFALNLQGATISTNFATLKEFARVTANLR